MKKKRPGMILWKNQKSSAPRAPDALN